MQNEIIIEIQKWDVYNYRKDVKLASWFRLEHSLFEDHELYGLNAAEMAAWIYILCCASKTSKPQVVVNFLHAERVARIPRDVLENALCKLLEIKKIIECGTDTLRARERTGASVLYKTRQDKHNKTRQDISARTARGTSAPVDVTSNQPQACFSDTAKSHDTDAQQEVLKPEIVFEGSTLDLEPTGNERKGARAARKSKSEGVCLWDTYKAAYNAKYGVEPVRNAKVNGQLSQLAKRLGVTEGCQVIEFYLQHNDAWYVKSMHSTDSLIRDAEKLRTEMLLGVRVTTDRAKKAEFGQELNDAFALYAKRDAAKRVSHD